MRGIKECPFSGVTNSDRVWRKVSESDARSVGAILTAHSIPPCGPREFSLTAPSVQTLFTAFAKPVECIYICAYVKNRKRWQPRHCLGRRTILHTMVGMGHAALPAME